MIRSSHVRVLDKSPAIINLIEQGITGAKRQQYNDLLTEIEEFYASTQDEPPAIPVPITESFVPADDSPPSIEPRALSPEQPTPPHIIFRGNIPEPNQASSPTDALPIPVTPSATDRSQVSTEQAASPQPTSSEPHPRRSGRSGASKPEVFYAKLNRGDSVADYTACHMRAAECERLYGAERTLKAGLSEIENVIGRGAIVPEDYRTLSDEAIREALPSFIFFKAKDELPDEAVLHQLAPRPRTLHPPWTHGWCSTPSQMTSRRKHGPRSPVRSPKRKRLGAPNPGNESSLRGDGSVEGIASVEPRSWQSEWHRPCERPPTIS